MIFWDNFKICTDSVTITVAASGSNTNPILNFGDTALRAKTLDLTTGFIIPEGTTFANAITLPAGSGITNVLTKQGNSGYTLTTATATISSLSADTSIITSVIAEGITNNGNLHTASATVEDNLTVNGSVTLPTNTTIGGSIVLPGPRQSNILKIDGHFEANDDWVSVYNISVSPIYIYIQLYQDAAYTTPYLANGQPVIGCTSTPITPGQDIRVLSFRDPNDQFYAMNGYIRIKYSLTEIVDSANKGNDLNKQIRAADISGYYKEVYAVYDPSTAPAPWLRTVLYESENEHWYVVNCNTNAQLNNMLQTMRAAPYNCRYMKDSTTGGWRSMNNAGGTLVAGVVGFKPSL